MTENYFFTDTEAGLTLMLNFTLSVRRHGFKTRTHLLTTTVGKQTFTQHVLVATPPVRPTRNVRLAGFLNRR